MLLRFAVSNFRSLSEEQEMLFTASRLQGDGVDLISVPCVPRYKLLPAALMYGANAAGKSNFLEAFRRMCRMVTESHKSGDSESKLPYSPFKLDVDRTTKPTTFSVDFVAKNEQFSYNFAYTSREIIFEELQQFTEGRASLLFRRDGEDYSFGRKLKGPLNTIRAITRPNSLFISAAAQNNHTLLTEVQSYFSSILFESSISTSSQQALFRINMEHKNRIPSQVIEFLSTSGTGIVSYKAVQPEETDEERSTKSKLREAITSAIVSAFGTDFPTPEPLEEMEVKLGHVGRSGETVFLDLSEESSGTKRLISSLPSIFTALERGNPVFVDEIDASLHTHVASLIIELFSHAETNPNGAQLIATTHDTNLLRSKCLRRDQVWFADKGPHGDTQIFSLADFKTRPEDNMEKAYLQGRFGAIPSPSARAIARAMLETE
jgi:AAA15 family ATPase/GTPase